MDGAIDRHIAAFLADYQKSIEQSVALPTTIAAEYEICDCLQSSSLKSTYLICSRVDGAYYILKVASVACRESLEEEYTLLRSLSAPAFPRAVTYFQEGETKYLIRAYVKGDTLRDIVEKNGSFSEQEAVSIVRNLCGALHDLHSHKPPIIHRDVKPQNVILTPKRTCALIDFGAARHYNHAAQKDTVYLGTQDTAAPEQFGYRQTDPRSDIYSTGILLLYLCTGSYELNEKNKIKDARIKKIVEGCTQFDPDRRYTSIRQLITRLDRITSEKKRVSPALFGGIALGLVAGAGLVYLLPTVLPAQFAGLLQANAKPAATATLESTGETAVEFVSPEIEQAVRKQLGLSKADPIYSSDLDQVTQLFFFGYRTLESWSDAEYDSIFRVETPRGSITSLADIPKLKNLKQLAICNQSITDLSPLEDTGILQLSLVGNNITDISPLANMPSLKEVLLGYNPIIDISPLTKQPDLIQLDLSGTSVYELSPIGDSNIETLTLFGTPVLYYDALNQLSNLQSLRITNLDDRGLTVVSSLHQLSKLVIFNSVTDLTPLLELTNLTSLDINHNDIQSLDGIDQFSRLTYLCLGSENDLDLSLLTRMENLQILDIFSQPISDYSPILQIPHLTQLYCSEEQKATLEQLPGEHHFTYSVLDAS